MSRVSLIAIHGEAVALALTLRAGKGGSSLRLAAAALRRTARSAPSGDHPLELLETLDILTSIRGPGRQITASWLYRLAAAVEARDSRRAELFERMADEAAARLQS